MLFSPYYDKNYAGIIDSGLSWFFRQNYTIESVRVENLFCTYGHIKSVFYLDRVNNPATQCSNIISLCCMASSTDAMVRETKHNTNEVTVIVSSIFLINTYIKGNVPAAMSLSYEVALF